MEEGLREVERVAFHGETLMPLLVPAAEAGHHAAAPPATRSLRSAALDAPWTDCFKAPEFKLQAPLQPPPERIAASTEAGPYLACPGGCCGCGLDKLSPCRYVHCASWHPSPRPQSEAEPLQRQPASPSCALSAHVAALLDAPNGNAAMGFIVSECSVRLTRRLSAASRTDKTRLAYWRRSTRDSSYQSSAPAQRATFTFAP
jgi:hypothetical protein